MRRPLPSTQEALSILSAKRTRPSPRPPPPAGRGLTKALKALDEKFGRGPDALKARWKEIVGEVLARRSEPARLIKSRTGAATLELRVDGPAAALIQHQSGQILQRVNLYLGGGAVTALRIIQGPLRPSLSGRPPPKRRRKAQPLDSEREAELAQSVAPAKDEALRAALTWLGREVLRGHDR